MHLLLKLKYLWNKNPCSIIFKKATKYTEIGYHGRDVDDIVKDLVSTTIRQYKSSINNEIEKKKDEVKKKKVLR